MKVCQKYWQFQDILQSTLSDLFLATHVFSNKWQSEILPSGFFVSDGRMDGRTDEEELGILLVGFLALKDFTKCSNTCGKVIKVISILFIILSPEARLALAYFPGVIGPEFAMCYPLLPPH